jgi:hypothetical protein
MSPLILSVLPISLIGQQKQLLERKHMKFVLGAGDVAGKSQSKD